VITVDPTIDVQRTIDLLRRLVQIESVNPTLVPGGAGEAEIALFLADTLSDAGLETRLQEVEPHRPNVLGRLAGSGGGKTLVFNAHLDTVSVEGMEDPYSARIANGQLFGRGAWDTKGGLAAGVAALLALRESHTPLRGDLLLAGAVDEEHGSLGTQALLEELHADGCVILEPSDLNLWVAHGGFAWAEIETQGVAAHGSLPDKGVDAIAKMGQLLEGLEVLRHRLRREKSFDPPVGGEIMHPSLHASAIEGGREWSSYPDYCRLRLERRMIPGETRQDVENELEELVAAAAVDDLELEARWRLSMVRPPWQAQEGPLLAALEAACIGELGRTPARATGLMWTDAALMQQAGIPTVIFGPAGEGKHALLEYVDIDSVVSCARILVGTALEFCNQSQ
jgi:acetylornithine deacetylase